MLEKKLMSKLLIDTNLLIYSIDQESKYFEKTNALFNNNKYSLYTTSKNLSEFLSVVTRLPYSPLNSNEAIAAVKSFQKLFVTLYPSSESYGIFIDLVKKHDGICLKIHDIEIVSIAISHEITSIATINKKDFDYIIGIDVHEL